MSAAPVVLNSNGAAADAATIYVPNFEANTRLIRVPLPQQVQVSDGQLLQFPLPRSGLLRGIGLQLSALIGGTVTSPNAAGACKAIKEVRLYQGGGNVLFDMSGIGYHYAFRNMNELGRDIGGYTNGRTAISATTFVLDMWIPVAPNLRDAVGLLNLQTKQTQYTLEVQMEAVANLATAPTLTMTVNPFMELFTMPPDPRDYPNDNIVQRVLEEVTAVTTNAEQTYYPLTGDIYLQLAHIIGGDKAAGGTDDWSTARIRFNQSSYVEQLTPAQRNIVRAVEAQSDRPKGLLLYDFMASAGLGAYDRMRDVVDSKGVSDFASLYTTTAQPTTVRTIRRVLTRV